ncbi:MAG TPA: hypothetical protein VHX17_00935 [Candidatus Cybelea sp.]|jgi:hypothetical protein|nr:hypothetical protein [Candidatus Cybelea sp.]
MNLAMSSRLLDFTEHRNYADISLPNGRQALKYYQHFVWPYADVISSPPSILPYRIALLADELNSRAIIYSNPARILEQPAFQELQKIGTAAIPQLIRWLEFDPYVWLVALPQLTGEDPVSWQHVTDVAQMVGDWKAWAVSKGFA